MHKGHSRIPVNMERSWSAAREQKPTSRPPKLSFTSSEWSNLTTNMLIMSTLLISHALCFLLGWTLRGRAQGSKQPSDVANIAEASKGMTHQIERAPTPEKETAVIEELPAPLETAAGLRERTVSVATTRKQKGFDLSPIKSTRRGHASSSKLALRHPRHLPPSSSSSPALVIQVDRATIKSLALPLLALASCLTSFGQSLESLSLSLKSASEAKTAVQRQAVWCRTFRMGMWVFIATLVLSSVRGGRMATVFRSCSAIGSASSKPLFRWHWSLVYAVFSSSNAASSFGNILCISRGLGLHAIGLAVIWNLFLPFLRQSGSSSVILGFSSSSSSPLELGDLLLDLGIGFGLIGSGAGSYLTSCLGGSWFVFTTLWLSWIAYLSTSIATEGAGGDDDVKKGREHHPWSRGLKIVTLSVILPILIGSLPFHPSMN